MSPHNPYLPAASTVPLTEDNEALKKAAAIQRGLSVSPPPSAPLDVERLRVLAETAACQAHYSRMGYYAPHERGGHEHGFGTCPHPDCLLVRTAPPTSQPEIVELKRWREWAQLVYLGGGPVMLSDDALRAAVCAAHDAEVAAPPEPGAAPPQPDRETLVRQLEYLRAAMRESLQLATDAPDEDLIDQANEHAEWLINYETHLTAIAKAAGVRLNGSEYQWSEATRAIVQRLIALSSPLPSEPPVDLVRQVFVRATTHRDLPAPEVHLDEDGDFSFDWGIRRDLTLTLFVGPSGNVGWAALIGDETSHGHFQWPAWSVQLDSALGLLQRSIAPLPSEPKPALGNDIETFIRKRLIAGLSTLTPVSAWSDDMNEILRLVQLAASPVSAVPPTPHLKMSDVRVGMRMREPRNEFYPLLTVTELTDKGFKYVLDKPHSRGSRYGVSTGGEHYGMDGLCLYELVADPLTPAASELLAIRERLQCLPDAKILDVLQSLLDDRDVAWQRVNAVTKELHQAQAENRELRKTTHPQKGDDAP